MSSVIGQDVLQVFLPLLISLETSCSLVTHWTPHQVTTRRAGGPGPALNSEALPCIVSEKSCHPSLLHRRLKSRKEQESSGTFLLAFIKHFAIVNQEGIEESELLLLPLKSQSLRRGGGSALLPWARLPAPLRLAGTGLPARRRCRAQPGF